MRKQPIWHAASRLVKAYGSDAPVMASRRAHTLLNAEEAERRKAWRRISAASKSLLQDKGQRIPPQQA